MAGSVHITTSCIVTCACPQSFNRPGGSTAISFILWSHLNRVASNRIATCYIIPLYIMHVALVLQAAVCGTNLGLRRRKLCSEELRNYCSSPDLDWNRDGCLMLCPDYGLGVRGIVVRILKMARNFFLTTVCRPAVGPFHLSSE